MVAEGLEPVGAAKGDATRSLQPEQLPKRRDGNTISFSVGGAEGYLTVNTYPDGRPGEIFLRLGKQGSTLAGLMDAFSRSVTIGLRYGVPLEVFIEEFTNLRFEPAGFTNDPDLRMAQSIMDYVFRRLALDHLSPDECETFGVVSAEERRRQLDVGDHLAQIGLAESTPS